MKIGIIAAALAFVGLSAVAQTNQKTNMDMKQLELVQEWDKTFPKSDKVEHSKVVFVNRFGVTLAADMYVPKPFDLGFLLAVLRNQLKSREIIRNRYKEAEQIVSPKTDTISNADEQFMRRLNELISSNLTNPDLDVQFVAAQMAMSRASLYNKLKLLAGISIGDYINKFRMAEAVRLLADKDLSIQEVSEKTGFSHQRYFSTVFKQIYGVTPSQYRQDL